MSTEYQLRQYVVEPGKMDDLVAIFPAVVEARQTAGFRVIGVWTVPEENRFIWIVATDHPEGIEGATQAYYTSPERAAITPEPSELLAEIETTTMAALPGF
jgi:hypothetical protein